MVYFLGRDLTVAITTESIYAGLVSTDGVAKLRDTTGSVNAAGITNWTGSNGTLFAGARVAESNTVFGDVAQGVGSDVNNEVVNLTGVDLSLGAMDEDLSFIGQRATMRVEVKKENSITLTRKKTNDLWDVIYNDARFGLIENFDTTLAASAADVQLEDGLTAPDFPAYGYRVYLKFRAHTDANSVGLAMAIPNCCITEHSITLGADATTEESITLQSYMDPIIVKEEGTDSMVADATGF
tara:strand:+ start:53 stop:772 length:720 start_codon:yes stop_codon:yes gene_type:complete